MLYWLKISDWLEVKSLVFLSWFVFQIRHFSFVLRDSLVCFVFLLSLKVLVGLSFDYLVLTICFSFLVIWVLLGKWTFVFFQVLFCFCCEHWKSNLLNLRALKFWRRHLEMIHWCMIICIGFSKEIENCICIKVIAFNLEIFLSLP